MADPVPEFVRFVSAVEGRLVTRWDTLTSYIGARKTNADERAGGAPAIEWDLEQVVPLTRDFCARFDKELRSAFRHGDLRDRSEKDYESYIAAVEKREAEAEAARAEEAKKAAAEEAPPEPAPEPEKTKGGDKPRTEKAAPTSAKES